MREQLFLEFTFLIKTRYSDLSSFLDISWDGGFQATSNIFLKDNLFKYMNKNL